MEGSDDEFFGDGEEEDTFDCGLRSAEFKAMEQRMHTLGFEEGVAQGTQKGIQRGFDAGYAQSKREAHPVSFTAPQKPVLAPCGMRQPKSAIFPSLVALLCLGFGEGYAAAVAAEMRRVLTGHALYTGSSDDAVEGVVRQMAPPLSRSASAAGNLVTSPSVASGAGAGAAAQQVDAAAESARPGDACGHGCGYAADSQAAEGSGAGGELLLPPAPPLPGGSSCVSGVVAGETVEAEGGCCGGGARGDCRGGSGGS